VLVFLFPCGEAAKIPFPFFCGCAAISFFCALVVLCGRSANLEQSGSQWERRARADFSGDLATICGCGLDDCSADCRTNSLRDNSAGCDLPIAERCADKLDRRAGADLPTAKREKRKARTFKIRANLFLFH
jgi:hypothetical protein